MEMEAERRRQSGALPRLGLYCTAVLGSAYAAFLILSACAPRLLATPVVSGSKINWAFALGFAVIGLGVFLTWFYAIMANRRERQSKQGAVARTRRVVEPGRAR